ncbi:hypothetical protein [Deinococcus aquaticus]|uniref:hypothetical protein n=1 Tax=Deinococcus aquaticus TaxID=328692 RepID=UPI003F479398
MLLFVTLEEAAQRCKTCARTPEPPEHAAPNRTLPDSAEQTTLLIDPSQRHGIGAQVGQILNAPWDRVSSVEKSLRLSGALVILTCVLAACGGTSGTVPGPSPQPSVPSPSVPGPAQPKISAISASKNELKPGETIQLTATTTNLNKVDWKIESGTGQLAVTSDLTAAYTASDNATDEKVVITASGPTGVQPQSISLRVLAPPLVFRDLNVEYEAADGVRVRVAAITPTPAGDSWKYTVQYELRNLSPNTVSEGKLQLYGPSGLSVPQTGFFGSLLPGESRSRTAEFITTADKSFEILAYGADPAALQPSASALLWRVKPLSHVLVGRTFFPISENLQNFRGAGITSDDGLNDTSILAGSYINVPEYLPTTFPTDSFLASIDGKGKVLWVKLVGKTDRDTKLMNMRTDKIGNIYTLVWEDKRGPDDSNATILLRSYDPEGSLRWEVILDGTSRASHLFIGENGTIAVATDNLYLFDTSGKRLWKNVLPFDANTLDQRYSSLTVASDNHIYAVASYKTELGSTGLLKSYLFKYTENGQMKFQRELLPQDNTSGTQLTTKTLLDGTTGVIWYPISGQGRQLAEYSSDGQLTNLREEYKSSVDSQCFGARMQPSDDTEKYFMPIFSYGEFYNTKTADFLYCSREEKLLKRVNYNPPSGVSSFRLGHITPSGDVLAVASKEVGKSLGMTSSEAFYLKFSINIDY